MGRGGQKLVYPTREEIRAVASVVAEPVAQPSQAELFSAGYPVVASRYPQIRFMGSKSRLLPWMFTVLSPLSFESVLDAFSGSGCVSYMFKAMGKQVWTNDFMNMSGTIARALIENPDVTLRDDDLEVLLSYDPHHKRFIQNTFTGVFFTPDDLRFLDRTWCNIRKLSAPYKRDVALAALIRSCAKRQPRGVFTIAGDPERYKDGRRDLRLTLREHFIEQVGEKIPG